MLLNGANIVGVAGLIKDSGALSRKLSTTKCNIGAAAKAQFKNKESVRQLSSEKMTAIAEERAAAIAKQRAVGNVGTYEALTDGKPFNDGKDAHHHVPQVWLKANGIPVDDGLAVMMQKSEHMKTNTYGPKAKSVDLDKSYRDTMANGMKDYIKVVKENGTYNDVRKQQIDGLKQHKEQFPDLYKKDIKK